MVEWGVDPAWQEQVGLKGLEAIINVDTWVFPTVSEVFMDSEPELDWFPGPHAHQGEREWHAAIATILSLLFSSGLKGQQNGRLSLPSQDPSSHQGMLITGPTPLLNDRGLFANFHNWTFTPAQPTSLQLSPCHQSRAERIPDSIQTIPLLPADPMAAERFCLVQTPAFSWVAMLRHLPNQGAQCQFSFVPETVQQVLQSLRSRIQLTRPHQLETFDTLLSQWPAIEPHYRLPLQFSRQLLRVYSQVASPPDWPNCPGETEVNSLASRSVRPTTAAQAHSPEPPEQKT